MNIYYNLFIFYIFSIKILFVLFSTTEMYYQWKNKKLEKTEKIENIKNEEYAKNLQLHRTEIKLGRFASPEFLSVAKPRLAGASLWATCPKRKMSLSHFSFRTV